MTLFLFGTAAFFLFLAALLFLLALAGFLILAARFHCRALSATLGYFRFTLACAFESTGPGGAFLIGQCPGGRLGLLYERLFDGCFSDGRGFFNRRLFADLCHGAVIGLLKCPLAAHLDSDSLCAAMGKALANLAGIDSLVQLELARPRERQLFLLAVRLFVLVCHLQSAFLQLKLGTDIGTLALYPRTPQRLPRQTVSETAGEDRRVYDSVTPEWHPEPIRRP